MLTVVTAAFYKDRKKIRYLEDTCERYGLNLRPYGIGEDYHGYFDAKVVRLREALDGVDTEYTLYCDGWDSMVIAGQERILAEYAEIAKDKQLVFSADHKPFPYPELGKWFQRRSKDASPLEDFWKGKHHRRVYLSAGVFMGKTDYLRECLDKLLRMYDASKDEVGFPEDDQGWWYLAITSGAVDAEIDYQARLVITTKYSPLGWYELSPGKCKLKPNGSVPCIVHFAGIEHTLDWLPKFYGRMFTDARS